MKALAVAAEVISLTFVGAALYGFFFGGPSVFESAVMALLLQLRADQMRTRSGQ